MVPQQDAAGLAATRGAGAAQCPVLLLSGPTASGKSGWAERLAGEFPIEIVSVDSALVYRGMDIGTAKPDAATRARIAHHLIDIRDPADNYSAGEFVADALAAIADIEARGRWPLLVGGTMLYMRALTRGLAQLPTASADVRAEIDAQAGRDGWPALHAELARVDPGAAARIHPNDPQRIQRALEVYRTTGQALSTLQRQTHVPLGTRALRHWALMPASRPDLHARIEQRFDAMLANGLTDEVARLHARGDLTARHPAIRAVGYRQLWQHLDGACTLADARMAAVAATRQLAKRQLTWLRGDPDVQRIDPAASDAFAQWRKTLLSTRSLDGR